ncbi:MAG: formylglycine-generating enzyme family protein [Rhodoferax sp.]|uniref:formylglycine-generating enzyme family protein n=1 Tax=Rhodoferax sp. TaxID=50421 RepID=UPI002623E99E|nr:formylglycine-generating enzyme family protein [Rhodoferax sp.]MDD2882848.1 formylglycine-generating enzyme family protein [Rhodoferax sp.]
MVLSDGSFQMGSREWSNSQPIHTVHIQSFVMGKYPVTQREWVAVMGNNPSHFSSGGDTCPVENVSWDDVQLFIQKLNAQTGHTYRLPSEAEWEYACRAGSTGKWCFGDDESEFQQYAWYDENSGDETHPVGKKKANGFGLYDMHGNVWEWCEDLWHPDYSGAPTTGQIWTDSSMGKTLARVLRGGCFNYNRFALAAYRNDDSPDGRFSNYGFRLAIASAR